MIGGKLLRSVGRNIFGRLRDRAVERIEERFDEGDPAAATAGPPAVKGPWEPPPWLALILKLLSAIGDYLLPKAKR